MGKYAIFEDLGYSELRLDSKVAEQRSYCIWRPCFVPKMYPKPWGLIAVLLYTKRTVKLHLHCMVPKAEALVAALKSNEDHRSSPDFLGVYVFGSSIFWGANTQTPFGWSHFTTPKWCFFYHQANRERHLSSWSHSALDGSRTKFPGKPKHSTSILRILWFWGFWGFNY